MADEEMYTKAGLVLPRLGIALRLIGRGLLLRCPNCGKGPVLKHWLKLRERCGTCGLRLERGEHDYFVGSMLLNFCLAGVLFLLTLAVIMIASWPDVPWDTLQILLPLLIIVVPLVLFPFSKLLWLAADIAMRPVHPEELEWHRDAGAAFSTDRPA
jgi:uncharacterized protein (DUF983 family)